MLSHTVYSVLKYGVVYMEGKEAKKSKNAPAEMSSKRPVGRLWILRAKLLFILLQVED